MILTKNTILANADKDLTQTFKSKSYILCVNNTKQANALFSFWSLEKLK